MIGHDGTHAVGNLPARQHGRGRSHIADAPVRAGTDHYLDDFYLSALPHGAKNGIFPVDEKTIEYMKEHSAKPYRVFEADEDAVYDETYTIDLSALEPTVAFPHLPENTSIKVFKSPSSIA